MSGDDAARAGGLSAGARTVAAELRRLGSQAEVVELPASTHTAAEAAAALGCDIAQIAKSLVFRTSQSKRPVLVIASGRNRVNVDAVGTHLGEPLERADPAWVREVTGFAVGGIPPLAHATAPVVYIDEDLLALDYVWAAAGSAHAVFRVAPAELQALTGGTVLRVS